MRHSLNKKPHIFVSFLSYKTIAKDWLFEVTNKLQTDSKALLQTRINYVIEHGSLGADNLYFRFFHTFSSLSLLFLQFSFILFVIISSIGFLRLNKNWQVLRLKIFCSNSFLLLRKSYQKCFDKKIQGVENTNVSWVALDCTLELS